MELKSYFSSFNFADETSIQSNLEYFESLLDKHENPEEKAFVIHQPEAGIESDIIPAAICEKELPVTEYETLVENTPILKDYNLILCKMHAGIGSSVERSDYLKNKTGREKLGSKGTDLFINVDGKDHSLAQLQIEQTKILKNLNLFKDVSLLNLVNEETMEEIARLDSSGIKLLDSLLQLKVPTLKRHKLTTQRVAPAGHAYLGFALLSKIFNEDINSDIYVIGNGEDLNSTADTKILSWVVENDIPVTMITTTKLEKDKKGGQISLVQNDERDYLTIIEKAQAEKSGQLEYFEQLGLREGDKKSLFNTNIVVINTKALKEKFNHLKIDFTKLKKIITPDLIKNVKEQDGQKFTQLEGAIGSVMLNLDKYFRLNNLGSVLHFLNLNPQARENFFIPIKKMGDFEELLARYTYNSKTGRFDLKGNHS